jgi:hypothetical protein
MMIPTLRAGPAFGSTVNVMALEPVPLDGMPATQVGTSLVVHEQTEAVEIVTVSWPPAVGNGRPVGAIE